jgi:hypothetical protein
VFTPWINTTERSFMPAIWRDFAKAIDIS